MYNPFVILLIGTVRSIIKSLCNKHTCAAGKHLLAHFKKLIKKILVVFCAPFLFLEGTER